MASWNEFRVKLARTLLGQRDLDSALHEEIRHHLEARTEELMAAGLAPEAARLQARREFGPALKSVEDSAEAWRWNWLDDLGRDLRHALRTLRKDRGFAVTATLSLALGIGFNTTIFSLTSEFLFSKPSVRDSERLFNIGIGGREQIPQREYRFVRDSGVFESVVGANPMQEVNWRHGDGSTRLFVTRVTGNYFDVTGVPLALGRGIADRETGVAVISHRFWRLRLNSDPQILGKALILDGRPHSVVGVLTEDHRTPLGFGYAPEMYLPAETGSVAMYARPAAGITRSAVLAQLQTLAQQVDQVYPDGAHKWASGVYVMPLEGFERLTLGFLTTVAAFFALLLAVVTLLLLIACANVASLLLARASARTQEFAIRMSIGAGRGRLIRQLLAESLLLSGMGTMAGLVLNFAITRSLNGLVITVPFPMKMSMHPDLRLLTYATVVALVSAVVSGLLPALRAARPETNSLLKHDDRQVSRGRGRVRTLLITGQLAVSVLVLILAALSVRNLIRSATLDPGFDLRNTIWAQMRLVPESYPTTPQLREKVRLIVRHLETSPGISSASIATFVPLNDHFASRVNTIYTGSGTQGARTEYSWNAVGPGYFRTIGIAITAGREFTSQDREGTQRVVVINEAMARRLFGGADPLGQTIRLGADDRVSRIVAGVARTAKYSRIGEKDRPALYEPYDQAGGGRTSLNFLVRTAGSPNNYVRALTATLLDADPAASIDVKPMSQATGFALLPSRAGAIMLGATGALGLLLAAVGFYGVLSYSITRRTREIGLRVALGAERRNVLLLVFAESGWILAGGLLVGMLVSVFVTRPLAVFLVPGLGPLDPAAYLIVVAVLAATGLAASLKPALRALRIDPITALRYE